MTLKRHLLNKRALRAVLPLAGLGIAAAALSGCGGASTTNNPVVPTPNSGPVVYGLNDAAAASGVQAGETSGIAFNVTTTANGTTTTTPAAALVAAFAYKTVSGAGPLQAYQLDFPNGVTSDGVTSSPGLALGFGTSGSYFNSASSTPISAIPTNYAGTLVFGAYTSAGVLNGNPDDLNTTSVVLTSSEASASVFSQPLSFIGQNAIGTSVLPQAQYETAAFPIPAFMQTTGLHDLHTTISTVSGQSSTTDFVVATVDPASVALFLQSLTVIVPAVPATATAPAKPATLATTAITPGDLVTIDGGPGTGVYPAGYQPTVADAQGTVVLFTTPGTHTLTETDPTGKTVVQAEVSTLPATDAGMTLLNPPTPDNAPAGSIRVIHPAVKRIYKRH